MVILEYYHVVYQTVLLVTLKVFFYLITTIIGLDSVTDCIKSEVEAEILRPFCDYCAFTRHDRRPDLLQGRSRSDRRSQRVRSLSF